MIHAYKMNGYNIILDQNSGCVHSVDEATYDIITMYESHTKDEIKKYILNKYKNDDDVTEKDIELCFDDIEALKADGRLFAQDTFEATAKQFKKRQGVIKAICLHVAHDCNLACKYCFAGKGEYDGPKGLMSLETGKRALDFLIEQSGTRRNLEVDFFGGEPLMNWEVVKRLVAYAREREKECGKHFRFTLTTNGMLVDDDVIEFSNREMDNVVMSLDGRKEVNDRFRKTVGGVGRFDAIVPKFQRFAAARNAVGKEYYIRGTFTHLNPDFMKDIEVMLDLGFDRLSMEPVVCDPSSPYALTEEDMPVVKRQYELLAQKMIERRRAGAPFVFYHYMLNLEHGPCIYKRLSGCGSGTEYLAVTPTGDLYPCHQFVGEKDFLMGNVYDGVTNTALRDTFKKSNVFTKPECAECNARLWCAGGCAANAFHATGSINGNYAYGCELFKKRLQCAIAVGASAYLDENPVAQA